MSDTKVDKERVNRTMTGQDYYIHLLVGITETRHCLATLREYVLSVWKDGDKCNNWQPPQRLLVKLAEQFGLEQQTLQEDTQVVSRCLQSLKHKVLVWDTEMQLQSRSCFERVDSEDKRNVSCVNNNNNIFSSQTNKTLQMTIQRLSNQALYNDTNVLRDLRFDDTGYVNESQDIAHLQDKVKDLISQVESQHDQIQSLLRANQNYKDDYKNKLKNLNRSMAMKMKSMNHAVMEAMQEENSNKKASKKYDHLLGRITALNSQLSEKKREVQTLKNVVNYNRTSSDNQMRKLLDELDEYKEKSELTMVHSDKMSSCGDHWKELEDLQMRLATLEQENTNLRHLLSLEVTQKLQLLTTYNEKILDRRHSLPGRVENETSPANHIYPMRRQHAIPLI